MPTETREVHPGKKPREVRTLDGKTLKVPDDWDLLLPGDAALSRRIKKDGPTWTMFEMKGRKKFSRGIWAPAERIGTLEDELKAEREDPAYQKKLEAGRARAAKKQAAYAVDFEAALLDYLAFAPEHTKLAQDLARVISAHAVPVGSGTVARTQRIPIEQRAEAAVIAWMRHQTTAYDNMVIPRKKGARREVRRMLAKRSKQLLRRYQKVGESDMTSSSCECPLRKALDQ